MEFKISTISRDWIFHIKVEEVRMRCSLAWLFCRLSFVCSSKLEFLPTIRMKSFFTGMFLIASLYLLLTYHFGFSSATSGGITNQETHRPRTRILTRFSRPVAQYARLKPEPFLNDIIDDDDLFEFSKRQTSDDYGHLRFGKRGEESFDDYGHMRFGRSGSEK